MTVLAVFPNLLLNLIDALTYGQVLLSPPDDRFGAGLRIDGFNLFLLSTALSQLVITATSSFKAGAAAAMMVEAIPFIHGLVAVSAAVADPPRQRLSTLIAGMWLLSVGVAMAHLILSAGRWRMERRIGMLPKPLLLGAMGGIGGFLLRTAMEWILGTSLTGPQGPARLLATWPIWMTCVLIAAFVLLLERRQTDRFKWILSVMPLILAVLFYAIVFAAGMDLEKLREAGWIFKGPREGQSSPFRLHLAFSPRSIDWNALLVRMSPTILAAIAFNLIHLPISIPSFGRITGQPFRIVQEYRSFGLSNLASGLVGLTPTYLAYANSLLFHRAGARGPAAGYLLGLATLAAIWMGGQMVIGFVPTISVLYLLFYLAFELVWEGLYRSRKQLVRSEEYLLIVGIAASMLIFGFGWGLLAGMGLLLLEELYLRYAAGQMMPCRFKEDYSTDHRQRRLVVQGSCRFYNYLSLLDSVATIRAPTTFLQLDLAQATLDLTALEGLAGCLGEGGLLAQLDEIVLVDPPRQMVSLLGDSPIIKFHFSTRRTMETEDEQPLVP